MEARQTSLLSNIRNEALENFKNQAFELEKDYLTQLMTGTDASTQEAYAKRKFMNAITCIKCF